jgi:hypothetical protein
LFSNATALILFTTIAAFGQVPADQAVIVIPGGAENIGQLEYIINNDVEADGVTRVNPNRKYQLSKDGVYIQQEAIVFEDTLATLRIVGEEGGNMPIVLMQPLDGIDEFTNSVSGNLSLENVYWPSMNLNIQGATLFEMTGSTARLELDKFVTENAMGDVFSLRAVLGYASVYIKNSYFRDNNPEWYRNRDFQSELLAVCRMGNC